MVLLGLFLAGAAVLLLQDNARSKAKSQAQQEAVIAQRAQESAAQREREALQAKERERQQQEQDLLKKSYAQFDDVLARFEDAGRIAASTSRIALAQPVASLQALHRDAVQLTAPPCLATGKVDLVAAMAETIEGYLVFMQNPAKLGDVLSQSHFESAGKSLARYREARAACPAA